MQDAQPAIVDAAPRDVSAPHVDALAALDGGPDAARPMPVDCFGVLLQEAPFVADYAIFEPVLGRHCRGSDHQEIDTVDQVVFVGDALTAGQPQWQGHLLMRADLAERLSERFDLRPPDPAWQELDPLTGRPEVRRSGDFVACADPLAETADLLDGMRLVSDCLLPDERQRRTLFIVTVGVRDVQRLTTVLAEGVDWEERAISAAGQTVDLLERAVRWMMDPANFPEGSFVVFSNVPDWTDGRGDTALCQGWPVLPDGRQRFFGRMMAYINGQFMRIAVDQGADLVFVQEHFCGHGINFQRPDPLCLGAPEPWVGESCRYLMPAGDAALSGLLWDVITDAE